MRGSMKFKKVNNITFLNSESIAGYQLVPVSRDSKWKVKFLLGWGVSFDSELFDTEETALKFASTIANEEEAKVAIQEKGSKSNGTK